MRTFRLFQAYSKVLVAFVEPCRFDKTQVASSLVSRYVVMLPCARPCAATKGLCWINYLGDGVVLCIVISLPML